MNQHFAEMLAIAARVRALSQPQGESSSARAWQVLGVVAGVYGFSVADLRGPARTAEISEARQVACLLAREVGACSWRVIGAVMNRTHSAAVVAAGAARARIATEAVCSRKSEAARRLLKEGVFA